MKRVFNYEKTEKGWVISGKKKPCSREKMFVYLWKEFCKQQSKKGRIIFETEDKAS